MHTRVITDKLVEKHTKEISDYKSKLSNLEGEKPKKSDEKVVKEKKVEKKVIEKNNKPGSKEIRDVKRKGA